MKTRSVLLLSAVLAGSLACPVTAAERDRRPEKDAPAAQQEETREERQARRRDELRKHREEQRAERRAERRQEEEVREERRSREARRERPRGNAERAARIARDQNGGGRVLSVNPEGDGYRVRMLKDGEVRSYWIKAD